jgi:hypothetical protein
MAGPFRIWVLQTPTLQFISIKLQLLESGVACKTRDGPYKHKLILIAIEISVTFKPANIHEFVKSRVSNSLLTQNHLLQHDIFTEIRDRPYEKNNILILMCGPRLGIPKLTTELIRAHSELF